MFMNMIRKQKVNLHSWSRPGLQDQRRKCIRCIRKSQSCWFFVTWKGQNRI